MSNIYHRAAICQGMLQVRSSLTSKHIISILGLTESIKYSSPIGIGMIATLMIERMPLGSTDELSGSMI